MISTLALLLPYSDADTAMSIRHLEIAYAAVFIIQFGYAAYVLLQRRKFCSKTRRNERPR